MDKREYDKQRYAQNKEKRKQQSRMYYENNKAERSLYREEYYRENKEKLLKYNKKYQEIYYLENKADILEKQKEYYEINKNIINYEKKKSRLMNLEAQRAYGRKQYYIHYIKRLVLGIKNRSVKLKLDFNIDIDFIENLLEKQNNKCSLTGISFEMGENNLRKSFRRPFAPSIDRIDCSKGYMQNNVRLVCVIVNLALNDFGDQDFDRMCMAYAKNKSNS